MTYKIEALPEHVRSRVVIDPSSGCWQWTGARRGSPTVLGYYGGLQVDGRQLAVHRYVYELLVGPIPDGLQIDHLCRNPPCCNPDHLEAVTQRTNLLRGNGISAKNASRTHCAQGHEYTPENTVYRKGRGRWCRACNRMYCARAYARRKQTKNT